MQKPSSAQQRPRPHQFSVTLPAPLMDELHAIAGRKAIAPATLARQWIAERLEVERTGTRQGDAQAGGERL